MMTPLSSTPLLDQFLQIKLLNTLKITYIKAPYLYKYL